MLGGSLLNIRHRLASYFYLLNFPVLETTSRLYAQFCIWIGYYICVCRAAPFLSGLVFSNKFADYTVVAVLITYFTDTWKDNLLKAVAIVNVQEGLSATLVIVMTYISDAHISRLKVILCSTAAYITGLVLLYLSAKKLIIGKEVGLFYIIVVMIAVGRAGGQPILKGYLADQFRFHEPNSNIDEDRVEARRKVWWSVARLTAYAGPLIFSAAYWPRIFFYSASVMGATGLLFLCAIPCYHQSEPAGSSLTSAILVLKAALLKRHLDYPSTFDKFLMKDPNLNPHNFFKRIGDQLYLSPQIKFLSWLDKAAIKETSSLSLEEQENEGRLFTVIQVEEMKRLLTMVPMWTTFLGFGLVVSTANTFFTEQGNDLQQTVSIYILLLVRYIHRGTISYLYNRSFSRKIPKALQNNRQIVRIWFGMVLSVFCCTVAWRVEVHRLKIVYRNGLVDKPKAKIPMSNWWLGPQFVLLGLLEGFGKDGLDEFFSNQVSESMEGYASEINDCVFGIGSFLNGFCVFVFRGWFADSINQSRLDKYYQMLAVVSFINLCYFWYVSITIYKCRG